MPDASGPPAAAKFQEPYVTASGEERAWVRPGRLTTLWLNTGTLCNLACANCYIESSPKNDSLVYLRAGEVAPYLDEIDCEELGTKEVGITGGEPFLNPDILAIMEDCLARGYRLIVLTNAMKPMMNKAEALLDLQARFGERLVLRVSVDHFRRELHEEERGARSWRPMVDGLTWLSRNGFTVHIAGRTRWGEDEDELRAGFAAFFREHGIAVDAYDRTALVLFPEMDEQAEVPEITTRCWGALGVSPDDMMCASSRMVVKRKGAERPSVMACTLLAYDSEFELGTSLTESLKPVRLNHPHCAKFCVLGGGSCSG